MFDLAGTAPSLLRSGIVATAVVIAGFGCQRVLRASGGRARRAAWALLLMPFLTPAILVGYGWQGTALALGAGSSAREGLYALLVLARLAPVAAVVLHFAPRAISPEAAHCHLLALAGVSGRARRAFLRAAFWLRGEGAAAGAAFAAVFLLAFGEFEIASLVDIRSAWTASLFDAHAGGLALGGSLRLALAPAAAEAVVLGAGAALVMRAARSREEAPRTGMGRMAGSRGLSPVSCASLSSAAAWVWLALAATLVTAVPACVVLRGAAADPGGALRSISFAKETVASLGLGAVAGGAAYWAGGIAAAAFARLRRREAGARTAVAAALALPGLLGPLVLSLAVLAIFQAPGLRLAYDTPLPLVVTVALLVLPFAAVLRTLVAAERPAEALHLAGMLSRSGDPGRRGSAGGLRWALDGRRRAWVAFLLFAWAYFDVTASYLLAPSGTTPAFVTLYNFMHYGRDAALSAMVAAAFAAPVAVLVAGGAAARLAARATAAR